MLQQSGVSDLPPLATQSVQAPRDRYACTDLLRSQVAMLRPGDSLGIPHFATQAAPESLCRANQASLPTKLPCAPDYRSGAALAQGPRWAESPRETPYDDGYAQRDSEKTEENQRATTGARNRLNRQ
ncbi:hypothetical protein [Aureliella helgolandensis]|uniref:Uncharacterized protein n=1 Tax=Aureliella helgolandensis TaxID=2527968 RepID=A0A518GEK0_9BACT|nr:hypothetical protein [Aureliella helgolandensis]QDV27026.1 hypothetical protein Q31a_54070 [Aureliella helgolandensis]